MRGGVSSDKAGSILRRQAELRDLEAEVARLLADLENHEIRKKEQQTPCALCASSWRSSGKFSKVGSGASTLHGQIALIVKDTQQMGNKLEALGWEQSELVKRQEALARKLEEAMAPPRPRGGGTGGVPGTLRPG